MFNAFSSVIGKCLFLLAWFKIIILYIYNRQFYCCFLGMCRDVQEVFKATPHEKQVMMFSATLPKEIRLVCKKFMNNVIQRFHLNLPAPRHLVDLHCVHQWLHLSTNTTTLLDQKEDI